MPISPMMLHSGLGIFAAIAGVALIASIFTLFTSWILLIRYRRAVARLMSADAGVAQTTSNKAGVSEEPAAPAGQDKAIAKSRAIPFPSRASGAEPLYLRAMAEPWHCAGRYAVAGVSFALTIALFTVYAFSQTQINPLTAANHPLQFAFMFWTFLWPVVLTTNIVTATAWRFRYGIVMAYFAMLTLLGGLIALVSTEATFQMGNVSLPAWSGETPIRLLMKWNLFNLAPTMLILAFRSRRVRAVAPLVLSFMIVLSAGLLGMYAAVFYYKEASIRAMVWASSTLGVNIYVAVFGYFVVAAIVACIFFGVVGWCVVVWIRRGYQSKSLSDQSLALDAIWLIFATFYAVIMVSAGPGWLLSAALAFLLFKIVLRASNRLSLTRNPQNESAAALLVLRVFSLGKRSETLFDTIAKHWRYVGNVQLIAGTDLAITTVAPHRFLAFVSRKLNQLFVTGDSALARNLEELDNRCDRDGRYRINDFFCHADTWQRVLSSLVGRTDAVLMDLRSFSRSNNGCVFEIRELCNIVPLRRVTFVTDKTTDKDFLNEVLEDAWHTLSAESPNRRASIAELGLFDFSAATHDQVAALLRQLCHATTDDK